MVALAAGGYLHTLMLRTLAAASCLMLLTTKAASADGGSAAPKSLYSIEPWADGPLIAGAALGTAIPYAFASRLITPRCPCDPGEVNAFDRHVIGNENHFLDSASDATTAVAALAPVALDLLDVGANKVFVEDVAVFSEVLAVNGAVVTLAKYTVQRPLPRVYAGQDPALARSPGGYRSFYSGHTSLTFAALYTTAWTLDARHGQGAWPWVAATAVGGIVAAERVAAGRHFYTDVMLGAAAGSVFGIAIPWLHSRSSDELNRISIAPAAEGAMAVWKGSLP